MSFLDKMPYFDNFILDGIVLLLAIPLLIFVLYGVYFAGGILNAVLRAFWDKLRNKKQ